MFQPETEDMLPRMAPKPSADMPNKAGEGIMRPQVPEVSILFGQQDTNLQQQTFNPSQRQNQTYAAWKKQMLPKVIYPLPADMANAQLVEHVNHEYNCAKTNLYPIQSQTNPTFNIASNANTNPFANSGGVPSQLTYRRSLESCNTKAYQQIHNLPFQLPFASLQPTLNHLPNTNSGNVLSICASTQTDIIFESTNYLQNIPAKSNFVSKKDIDNVVKILDELRAEQQRMSKILEAVLLSSSQTTVRKQCRDIGVQVNLDRDYFLYSKGDGSIETDQHVPRNKFLQHLKPANNILQQIPNRKPVAQSTTYRPNSPQNQATEHDLCELEPSPVYQHFLTGKPTLMMSRSASDTSIAMNELALKYLPNDKLAELLKELNIDCPQDTANINLPTTSDKFEKRPSDISNASYRYLKKYRLLPEDHDDRNIENRSVDNLIENDNEKQILKYNSPLHNIQNESSNQRQTPTNKCSPYAGRLPLSPLARISSPHLQSTVPPHLVNLENIKHQPKFL